MPACFQDASREPGSRCLRTLPGGWPLLTRILPAVALIALFPACAPKGSDKGKPRVEVAPVLAAQAVREDVPVVLRTIGTVEAYRSVSVRARVVGTLVRVHFREGQDIRAGERLVTIDPRPYEVALKAAEAELDQARARAALATLDARRSAGLLAEGLVSDQEDQRLAATAAAESAAVRSLEANVESARLNLEFCSITAPISGRTSNLLVHEGNLVRANDTQALVVINQILPVYVNFSIPERRLPEVLQYLDAGTGLPVDASPSGAAGEPAHGRLTFINNAVDPATGTILLKAEFPNEDGKLWPGEYVQVGLTLTIKSGALVVPAAAVQTGQKGDYVLVVKADQTTEMRPVTCGLRLEGKAIIETGLEPGETVITDGHLRVVPGAKVAIKSGLESEGAQGK